MSSVRDRRRLLAGIALVVWTTLVLAAFYVVQRPLSGQVVRGMALSAWNLGVAVALLVGAAGLGTWLLERLGVPALSDLEHLCLSIGVGLGLLGLAGLGLALLGLTGSNVFLVGHVLLLGGAVRTLWSGRERGQALFARVRTAVVERPVWAVALGTPAFLATLMALTPPADGFDALLYHLSWPAWVIRTGGLQPYDISPFWFPHLVEGVYLWAMGMGAERAPQLLHVTWGLLAGGLLFVWGRAVWGARTGRWALLVLVSMPSLPLLASWAYTDLALVFYALGTLFALWRWHLEGYPRGWLVLGGVLAGMAMGVKYTSFVVPMTAGALIAWWLRSTPRRLVRAELLFSGVALAVAMPWYARNWAFMGNPFYPFVFGGRFWDAFRAAWYANAGTGIGVNVVELLLLPLNVTLGHRDATYFDGRIGPLYLLAAPLTLWALRREWGEHPARRPAWLVLGLFFIVGAGFWTMGVMRTVDLWQARLLLPALFPLALLTARGLLSAPDVDTVWLRASFVLRVVVAGVVVVSVLDVGLFVVARNPLAVITGVETPVAYRRRVLPEYTAAMELLARLPADARVYFLFEPRSYGAPRDVQPDPLLYNFAHGIYLEGDAESLARAWRRQGYTHVLLYRWGADFLAERQPDRMTSRLVDELDRLTGAILVPVAVTPAGDYELYRLPEEVP
ncbi:MAG: glycosyltransferase family 39 protein [Ardenticatenia bacterium]|nr:glycosyltransferase family 39 protein [Ardenticatenia bacterium]